MYIISYAYVGLHFGLWYLFMCRFNRLQYENFSSHSTHDTCDLVKCLYVVVQVLFTLEDMTIFDNFLALISDIILSKVSGGHYSWTSFDNIDNAMGFHFSLDQSFTMTLFLMVSHEFFSGHRFTTFIALVAHWLFVTDVVNQCIFFFYPFVPTYFY